jgi:hypothetical protein
MVGVITGAEVITMVGVEAEATITGGGTIIAIGNDCWSPLRLGRPRSDFGTLCRRRPMCRRRSVSLSSGCQGRRIVNPTIMVAALREAP